MVTSKRRNRCSRHPLLPQRLRPYSLRVLVGVHRSPFTVHLETSFHAKPVSTKAAQLLKCRLLLRTDQNEDKIQVR